MCEIAHFPNSGATPSTVGSSATQLEPTAEGMAHIALRILSCWMDRKPPSPEDTQQLQAYLPELSSCEPDELACIVVKRYIKA